MLSTGGPTQTSKEQPQEGHGDELAKVKDNPKSQGSKLRQLQSVHQPRKAKMEDSKEGETVDVGTDKGPDVTKGGPNSSPDQPVVEVTEASSADNTKATGCTMHSPSCQPRR